MLRGDRSRIRHTWRTMGKRAMPYAGNLGAPADLVQQYTIITRPFYWCRWIMDPRYIPEIRI